MFENVSFCQPLGAAFDSPGERGLGALSRLPRNRPNCLTIRRSISEPPSNDRRSVEPGLYMLLKCQKAAVRRKLRDRNPELFSLRFLTMRDLTFFRTNPSFVGDKSVLDERIALLSTVGLSGPMRVRWTLAD